MNTRTKAIIAPETRIGELLDDYPELESVLIEMTPAFSKLKSPLLRKTVAKIATIRQAAKIGGVSLAEMVNKLRQAAGITAGAISEFAEETESIGRPDWLDLSKVTSTLDARPMIECGDHPIGQVMKALAELPQGAIYELVTPFIPYPLIEKAKAQGCNAWSVEEDSQTVRTYFIKR